MNKTALVTGSTSGIGLAIARTFAQQGYNVVFNGLENNGEAIASQVASEFNVKYFFSPANLLDRFTLGNMVVEALKKFGSIDILVNNAGIQHVSPIENFPEEKWDEIINVNLSAAFHLTKAVWPSMKAKPYGRIINIASAHGSVASEFKSAYVASKHGLIGLTKTTALEGAPFNITCNAICPGYVKTALVEKQIADQSKLHGQEEDDVIENFFLKKHVVKQFVDKESIAALCLFLASPHADAITGAALPVDAGWTAQ
jgi:3-hydroxybutyrate dehydrogenase